MKELDHFLKQTWFACGGGINCGNIFGAFWEISELTDVLDQNAEVQVLLFLVRLVSYDFSFLGFS